LPSAQQPKPQTFFLAQTVSPGNLHASGPRPIFPQRTQPKRLGPAPWPPSLACSSSPRKPSNSRAPRPTPLRPTRRSVPLRATTHLRSTRQRVQTPARTRHHPCSLGPTDQRATPRPVASANANALSPGPARQRACTRPVRPARSPARAPLLSLPRWAHTPAPSSPLAQRPQPSRRDLRRTLRPGPARRDPGFPFKPPHGGPCDPSPPLQPPQTLAAAALRTQSRAEQSAAPPRAGRSTAS